MLRSAALVSFGAFIFGFDASVISGVVPYLQSDLGLSDQGVGLVVGAPTLAGVLAGLVAGPLSDQIGRRRVLDALAVLYLVSAAGSAFAPDATTLATARFLGGLAFATLGIGPVYISEIAPPDHRGRLVTFSQLAIVSGFAAAYFANYGVLLWSQHPGAWGTQLGVDAHPWRWMLGLELGPALAWIVALWFVPHSPRWLVLVGREAEARQVLAGLGSRDVEAALRSISDTIRGALPPLSQRIRALGSSAMRRPLAVALAVGITQQACGINAVYFYAPTLFEQSGISTNAAFAQATVIGVINVLVTLIAMALMDRLGRRPLLLVGMLGVITTLLLAAWGFAIDRSDIVFVAVLGFVGSFALSLGPVMWVLFGEIFPNRTRGVATAFAGVFNGGVSFVVQAVFPWELGALGPMTTFLVYAGLTTVGAVLVYHWLPETRGQSLEELERRFAVSQPRTSLARGTRDSSPRGEGGVG